MKKLLLPIISILILVSACQKDEIKKWPNYISIYTYDVTEAYSSGYPSNSSLCDIVFIGTEAIANTNNKKFTELSRQFNDLTYNGVLGNPGPYLADTIANIDIICKQDYNATHPAETLLNDIIQITSASCKQVLESDYKIKSPISTTETIQEFNNRKDKVLLDIGAILDFGKPSHEGEYDIIIKVQFTNGITVSTDYKYITN